MKISNETKIGLFATLTIAAGIWGYKFLKGQSLFDRSITLYADFRDAQQINRSAPIYFHGIEIGTVTDFFFKPDDISKVTLAMNFKRNPGIPKNAKIILFNNGLLGGRALNLEFEKPCTNGDCAENGSYLEGVTMSNLESMIGKPEDMDAYIDKASKGMNTLMDSLSMTLKDPDNEVGKSLRDIQITLLNLKQTTAALSQLMALSSKSVNVSMQNVAAITSNLKDNNEKISSLLSNINDITGKANTVDFSKINKAADGMTESIESLKKTLSETESGINQLTTTIKNVNAGEGTLGQLATNDSIYRSMNMTLLQTQALMQDVRLNPKRYINLNPFRKYKPYKVPSQDPLLDSLQKRYNNMLIKKK